jgi:hypothetical protein
MRSAAFLVPFGLLVACGSSGTSSPGGSGGGGASTPFGAGGVAPAGSGGSAAGAGGAAAAATGGDPGAGTGGVSGAAGTLVVSAVDASVAYDPSVKFDWPESDAAAGKCEPGKYVGQFTCSLEFIPGFPPGQVTGPVTFTLEPSANGEFLEIKNGRLDATANGTYPFGCDLVGTLDCSTFSFQATAQNGTYGTPPFGGTFFGDMSGSLDPLTSTLSGNWALTAGTMAAPQANPCKGPWTAVRQP